MKLYRAKIPAIATDCIGRLLEDGDIDIVGNRRPEAEADLVAIMEDYTRRDAQLRDDIKSHMSDRGISYDQYGKTRTALAESRGHVLGEDVERYLARQFAENLMISPNVDEVFSDDKAIYKKLIAVIKGHDVDEERLREDARARVKNIKEGTVEYEIALENALRDVKKRAGVMG